MKTNDGKLSFREQVEEKVLQNRERKAIKKFSNNDHAFLEAQSKKDMTKFLNRGWQILSHSPSNYAHGDHYLMRINRAVLEDRLK